MCSEQRSRDPEITGPYLLAVADAIEEVFRAHGIRNLDETELGAGIATVRDVGSFPGQPFRDDPRLKADSPSDSSKALLAAGVARCIRIALVLKRATGIPGLLHQLRHIRNLNPVSPLTGEDKPWDILLEVEVAALALHSSAEVRFDEPDVILRDEAGVEFALACKRPRKAASVSRAFDRALAQCNESSRESMVIIGVDLLTRPGVVLRSNVSAQTEYRKVIDASCGGEFERARIRLEEFSGYARTRLLGAMFVGSPLLARAYPSGGGGWLLLSPFCARLLSNPSDPHALGFLRRIREGLEAGDLALRRTPL